MSFDVGFLLIFGLWLLITVSVNAYYLGYGKGSERYLDDLAEERNNARRYKALYELCRPPHPTTHPED